MPPRSAHAKAPVGGADQIFAYLGRYTHRVGISNRRILRSDADGVTFTTKNGVNACRIRASATLRVTASDAPTTLGSTA